MSALDGRPDPFSSIIEIEGQPRTLVVTFLTADLAPYAPTGTIQARWLRNTFPRVAGTYTPVLVGNVLTLTPDDYMTALKPGTFRFLLTVNGKDWAASDVTVAETGSAGTRSTSEVTVFVADTETVNATVTVYDSIGSTGRVILPDATGTAATDTSAVTSGFAALEPGDRLVFGTGDYVLNNVQATPPDDCTIDLSAATSITGGSGITGGSDGFEAMLRIGGSQEAAVALTGDSARGSDTITVTGHGFAVDDLVIVGSDALFSAMRDQHRVGQFATVASVTANTVTFHETLYDALTVADVAKIRRVNPVRGVTVHGGKCQLRAAATGRQIPLLIHDATDVTVSCSVDGTGDRMRNGVALRNCREVKANVSSYNVTDASAVTVEGYGTVLWGCEYAEVAVEARGDRHGFDVGSYANAGAGGNVISRHVTVRGTASKTWAAGFSSHAGSDFVTFDRVVMNMCGGGGISRGSNTTWIQPSVNGVHANMGPYSVVQSNRHALSIGEQTQVAYDEQALTIGEASNGGPAGTNLTITGPRLDLTLKPASLDIMGIRILDPIIGEARITNPQVVAATHPIYGQVSADTVDISGGLLDQIDSGYGSYRPPIMWQAGQSTGTVSSTTSTGVSIKDFKVTGVTVRGSRGPLVRVYGHTSGRVSVTSTTGADWRGTASDTTSVVEIPAGTLADLVVGLNVPTAAPTVGGTVTRTFDAAN